MCRGVHVVFAHVSYKAMRWSFGHHIVGYDEVVAESR